MTRLGGIRAWLTYLKSAVESMTTLVIALLQERASQLWYRLGDHL